ncbi:MAG TPA: hypothetical protein VEI29_07425 [Burkholderiaceae bacterium]|nr:hypothetical protein [Burkholderiaceae bacterium]
MSTDSRRLCDVRLPPEADIGTAGIYEHTPWFKSFAVQRLTGFPGEHPSDGAGSALIPASF